MNEAGVLGRFVPEFGRVVALMQFNMYHHYTVDEHLIRAIGNLSPRSNAASCATNCRSSRDLDRSASNRARCCMSRSCCTTWPRACPAIIPKSARQSRKAFVHGSAFLPPTPRRVSWLVRNHLVMSDTAQKRDVSDPKTVQDFVGRCRRRSGCGCC